MPEATAATDPTIQRLEEQLRWYGDKSRDARRKFKTIKVVEIFSAAMIPFLGSLQVEFQILKDHIGIVTGALGVLITVLEGILHLNQYQEHWTTYRATAEALKHEKYLFLAGAGAYTGVSNPKAMLAERVETLASQENAAWSSLQQKAGQEKGAGHA